VQEAPGPRLSAAQGLGAKWEAPQVLAVLVPDGRFLEAAQNLGSLAAGELGQLNVALPRGMAAEAKPGIF